MTSFAQLCQDVITKTNRPELVAETQLAVRDATKLAHLSDFYLRDSVEQLFQYNAADFNFRIDTSVLARYRKIKYIKKFDLDSMVAKEGEDNVIKEVDPTALFDRFNSLKTNVFYLAGTALNLKLSTSERGLLLAWYQYPNTDVENFFSWIADMYSPAIVDMAAAKIFRDVGMTDDANRLEKYVLEVHYPLIRMNEIEATAR